MWALVKNDVVDTIYYNAKSVVIDNVRYPSNMFTLYTTAEKKRIGVYDIVRKSKPDPNFYNISTSTYTYDSGTDTVNEDFNITEKDLEDLQTSSISQAKRAAYTFIQPLSWLTQRNVFDNTQEIPSDVLTYTNDIRTFCRNIITAVEGCNTLSEFKIIFEDISEPDGQYNTWPDNSAVEKYERY